jgi:hypothetical protein
MTGVSAIHYSLRDVNATAHGVNLFSYVHLSRDWAGVDSHANFELVAHSNRFGDFQSAPHWGNEISRENECHSIARRELD